MIRRSGLPGLPARSLRARISVLATTLVAVVSVVLLWLAWRLVGDSVAAVPQLPPGTLVRIHEVGDHFELRAEDGGGADE